MKKVDEMIDVNGKYLKDIPAWAQILFVAARYSSFWEFAKLPFPSPTWIGKTVTMAASERVLVNPTKQTTATINLKHDTVDLLISVFR